MERLLKLLFFGLLIKPFVRVVLGLNVSWRERLPQSGPAIIVANHNSHLDTMVLMSLYPLSKIHKVRPVAAADYFLQQRGFLAWLSLKCIGIVPIDRKGESNLEDLFSKAHSALDEDDILILFPEGSRGKPEQLSKLKKGVYFLIKDRANVTVTPVVMAGLGQVLPKGRSLLVPFNCDVVIGEQLEFQTEPDKYIEAISLAFEDLSQYCLTRSKPFKEEGS